MTIAAKAGARLMPALKAPPCSSQGNALGSEIDRSALQGLRDPPPLQGGAYSTRPRGVCPGLARYAPLARQRG
jgi:hypothetical protein